MIEHAGNDDFMGMAVRHLPGRSVVREAGRPDLAFQGPAGAREHVRRRAWKLGFGLWRALGTLAVRSQGRR